LPSIPLFSETTILLHESVFDVRIPPFKNTRGESTNTGLSEPACSVPSWILEYWHRRASGREERAMDGSSAEDLPLDVVSVGEMAVHFISVEQKV
jgi:hypothetical protein